MHVINRVCAGFNQLNLRIFNAFLILREHSLIPISRPSSVKVNDIVLNLELFDNYTNVSTPCNIPVLLV